MNFCDKRKYVSGEAHPTLIRYIESRGYEPVLLDPLAEVDSPIAAHADIQMCRLGCRDDSPVIRAAADELVLMSGSYPCDVPFNAAATGSFFVHRLELTSPRLLAAAQSLGMEMIDVRQGYAKCSIVVVDENSIITYDRGIAAACEGKLDVLLIRPGHINLPGYDTGFIGGCTGRLGDEIIFNGKLSAHPNGDAMRGFIEERGLLCTAVGDYPLTDIGSII